MEPGVGSLLVTPRPKAKPRVLGPGFRLKRDLPESIPQETPGRRFRNMNNPSDPLVTMIVPLSKNG